MTTERSRRLRGALSLALAAVVALVAAPAAAQGVPREALLVVGSDGGALDGGGGSTPFAIGLPDGASCPGDSAHDGYRVDSFMLPIAVDAVDVGFTGAGPEPTGASSYDSFRQPLYDTLTNSFSAAFTAEQTEVGGPGDIVNLPPFSFGVFVDGFTLHPGAYRVGIACTLRGEVTNLWETTIEVSADATDEPVGIGWAVTGSQPEDLDPTSSGLPGGLVQLLLAAAAALAVIALFLHRSARSAPEREPAKVSR